MNLARYNPIILLLLLIFIWSCKNDEKKSAVDIDLIRYDKLLMELDSTNIKNSFTTLESQHPAFTDIYFNHILPIPGYATKSDSFYRELKSFIKDKKIKELYQLVLDEYPDLNKESKAFSMAFQQAKKWLPEASSPRIYTFISEFGYQRLLFEDGDQEGLAIGLDLFLENSFDYSVLKSPENAFSNYLTRTYDKEHLVKKSVEAWLEDNMGVLKGDRLIDHMIYNGTRMYILDDILNVADSVITEYPEEKLNWVRANEKEMWSFYFKNDWFYTTDQYVIKRLVNPAPNTIALQMPTSAPGQTANYLGWRIIQSYMKRYPETTLEDLLNTDAQKILETSKFKPGK